MSDESAKGLVAQFLESAHAAAATAETVGRNAEDLNASLLSATADDTFVLFSQPDDLDPMLFHLFLQNPRVITSPTKEQLSSVEAGVTDAFCGIASTGSVCVSITKSLTSPISMLTRKHIVVVDSDTIVPRPRDVFSDNYVGGRGLRRSFSFITGPSATADMGPLVRGVHGPRKLHIIVLE